MANTYILISSNVLASSAASVTFSSIPATYTDLVVKVSSRTTASSLDITIGFNGVTTSYSDRVLYGSGTAAASGVDTSLVGVSGLLSTISTYTASTFSNSEAYIPNYTSSNYKSVSLDAVTETNATAAYSYLTAGLWSNTSSITSIIIKPISGSNNFVANSSFYLYGISNA